MQITSDGKLRGGPSAIPLLTTPSSFVWSVAADENGAVFLGTGTPATVLRLAEAAVFGVPHERWIEAGHRRRGG